MNIVNSGNSYTIYGDDVKTFKQLPANTYKLFFVPMQGFKLQIHDDLEVNEKVYGPYIKKVQKVMNTFEAINRNLGIILSGPKGAGKSVFARLLAEEGKKKNMPLIIIDRSYDGLTDFIESIKQECIIVFDEFEKIFDEEQGDQDKLLSLFDGLDSGKKLYVITCNDTDSISPYYFDRPGRFHYHFTLGAPTEEEIQAYLEDNLIPPAKKYIKEILPLSVISQFTYDILRAIVFELNNGYNLAETLQDLNISPKKYLDVKLLAEFTEGVTASSDEGNSYTIDFIEDEFVRTVLTFEDYGAIKEKFPDIDPENLHVVIKFKIDDMIMVDGHYYIDPTQVKSLIRTQYDHNAKYEDVVDWANNNLALKNLKITVDNKWQSRYTKKFKLGVQK